MTNMPTLNLISRVRWKLDSLACSLQVKSALPRFVGHRGRLTICFDDFPQSAARIGAEILEKNNAHGTYFVSMGLEGRTENEVRMFDRCDIERVWTAGHEIGCHTYGHVDCRLATGTELANETQRNKEEVLNALKDCSLSTFAFPKGRFSLRAKKQLSDKFTALRSTAPGLNNRYADANMLKAYPLYDSKMNFQEIENLLQRACAENAWLILYTHDVQSQPSQFGCSPSVLDFTLKRANEFKMDIRSMKDFS